LIVCLDVFLLLGQSNMAGRGKLCEVEPLSHPNVLMLKDEKWILAEEPLHSDKPEIAGVGLGMSFAYSLVSRGVCSTVGLVPCAVGGTPLSMWVPGAELYVNALNLARVATNRGERIRGVLWHQGEGDCQDRENAKTYLPRFRSMINSLRTELGNSEMPVLIGGLGEFLGERKDCRWFPLVNEALKEVALTVPFCAYVSAEGLHDIGDNLHFSSASLREFGRRYAKEYVSML
jgi:hypothetical protein